MERNVLITADSTCDLPAELKKKYNISTYPLHIILGRTSYDDGVNITPDEIYKHFKASGTLPKTSAVNVQEYIDGFLPLVEQGYEIVHINLGSALSASYKIVALPQNSLAMFIRSIPAIFQVRQDFSFLKPLKWLKRECQEKKLQKIFVH